MSRAQQLPLMLSLADSATLHQDRERANAYAQEHYDRAQALRAENAQLRDALKAEQARSLELERQLIYAETMARTWQAQVQLLRRTDLPMPRVTPSKDALTELLFLVHPDHWSQGQTAIELAHEVTVLVNKLREGVQA